MNFFKDRYLILSLLLGLLIRLILTPITGFKFDVDTWFAWAQRLNEVGFANFYSDKIWTGYTPGFLYILSLLGFIKTLFQIGDSLFFSILKYPSIIAEIILGFFIYQIIPTKYKYWKRLALVFVMLNPAFIFNSAIFGQFDGLFSLTVILSVYFLTIKKITLSSLFWGIAFLLKPQAIFLLPVFVFFLIKNFSVKNIFQLSIPAFIAILTGFIPFFAKNPIGGPIELVNNLFGYYPYNSIFAYNLWGVLGFWIPDSKTFLNVSYQNLGYIFYGIYCMFIVFYFLRNKISIFTFSTLTTLGFFFLLTRMHERYLYPSLIFLILISVLKKSPILVVLTTILSLIHFLDLYYVYIYYNQFYLKMPQIIYNANLYNFADKNIQLISFFSTLIFFLISISILKLDNEYKKT